MRERHLAWEGCWNARDLGGLPTADGRTIRWGALVRSDHLMHLSGKGWQALQAYGVGTLIDLRTTEESRRDRQHPPAGVTTAHVPLEDGLEADADFASWMSAGLCSTPLYYPDFLRRWPDRCARAVAAVAQARAGGVLIHCSKGCDRTGLLVMLLLRICCVRPEAIADDYALTAERLRTPLARGLGRPDDEAEIRAVLEQEGCADVRSALLSTMRDIDLVACLRAGGLTDEDENIIRDRLLSA